ncbi:hypothetical protein KFL_001760050 [Klebsormidium nitens]|uniref:Patatin n=1 Tax=Klebsormidium nitens TaxID=105231 RepID=A0A1Y1I5V2_KLENI|nr:hypothetical protein KFL_001760050 [Klebsormidium nitens]|eukprot:GAQ84096.1 hypothetical protein KFL_001760050 [Klebsormidium nitens]
MANKDEELAAQYQQAADLGDAEAMTDLGMCYMKESGVEKDEKKAAALFQQAADLGYARAMTNLGNCYRTGTGVEKDEAKAVALLRRAADLGNTRAMFNLGVCYANGMGVEKNEAEAVALYQRAADLGHARAMFNLGVCYQNGRGVEKNEAEAVAQYQQAADLGDAAAMTDLGWCHMNGSGVEKDEKKAVALFRRAADLGDARAMTNLGVCCERGTGVEKHEAEAVVLYRLAADLGDAMAMSNLGGCYARGMGVEKDEARAVALWRQAADLGNAMAMVNLGSTLQCKLGARVEDFLNAKELYERANGLEENECAHFNIGLLYSRGSGVPKDWARAKHAFQKASNLGLHVAGTAFAIADRLSQVREEVKPVRILSIDGGGIRGVLPAEWLGRLEQALGGDQSRPLHDCFDIVAGTSTGGIIATMLCAPNKDLNRDAVEPMFSAAEIEGVYRSLGKRIFSGFWARLRCFGWCCFPKHAAGPLERELEEQLGELRLEDALTPLVIPAYEVDNDRPVVFSSLREEHRGKLLREVCRATSAAPTFFVPAVLDGKRFLDGGIYVNNPTMLAITHALENRKYFEDKGRDHVVDLRNLFVVSLGTGFKPVQSQEDHASSDQSKRARPRGCYCFFGWIGYLVKASMKGSAMVVHDEVERLFKSFGAEENYIRVDIPLVSASKAMDDNSDEQLKRLADDAKAHLDRSFDKAALEKQLGRMEPTKPDGAEAIGMRGALGGRSASRLVADDAEILEHVEDVSAEAGPSNG